MGPQHTWDAASRPGPGTVSMRETDAEAQELASSFSGSHLSNVPTISAGQDLYYGEGTQSLAQCLEHARRLAGACFLLFIFSSHTYLLFLPALQAAALGGQSRKASPGHQTNAMGWAQLCRATWWAVRWGPIQSSGSGCPAGSKLEGVKGGMAISWEQVKSWNDPQDFLSPSRVTRWSEFGVHFPSFTLPGERCLSF